jgi:hypothetical protein
MALDTYVRLDLRMGADVSDASTGSMILSVNDGRVSAEMKSQGLHFGHRNSALPAPPNGPQSNSIVQPRRVEPHPAAAPRPTPAAARPTEPVASAPKILAKPTEAPTGASTNKSVPPKPAQPAQGPRATTAPAQSTINTQNPPSSIPPKPAAPSRQPRGPGSVAQAPPPPANKVENKPAATAPVKPSTPVGNRKSPAPGPKADKAPSKLATIEAGDKKVESAPTKPEKKAEGDKPEEAPSIYQARPHEKRSLFLKKIPIPTSEEEIKALFPNHKSKVSCPTREKT